MPGICSALLLVGVAGQVRSPADPATLAPLYEQVLAERRKEFGTSAKVARSASDLGLFLKSIGDFKRAEAPLVEALRIDEALGDTKVSEDRENLAQVLNALGRHGEAFDLLQQAAKGADAAVAARSLMILAAMDAGHAVEYYRGAIEAEERASGKEHPRVAIALNNLALALRERDDNAAAEPLFRRALAIQTKALGADHAAVASTLNNLGSLLQATNRLAEAERDEREALRIFEHRFGPESKELATTLSNLADLLWTKGDRASAAGLYRRALAMDEAIYGAGHPEVAGDLRNLGMLLKESGQAAKAQTMLRRALAIYEKTLGASSPQANDVRKLLNAR
jgi:tetratricopeptide (TPR) repeat protein